MLIGTHALSPVVGVAALLLFKKVALKWRELGLIALAGALPDILNPHIYLADRHTSWSHSLIGFATFTILVFIISLLSKRLRWQLAGLMSLAYLWHLACDTISGGIPYLYPFVEGTIGFYIVPLWSWLLIDVFFILATWTVFAINKGRRLQ